MAKCVCCGQPIPDDLPKKQVAKSAAWIDFVEKWNQFAAKNGLPALRENNTTIASKFFARLKDKEFWADLRDACRLIQSDAFFRGTNDREWKASAKYLLEPGKLSELAERYRASARNPAPPRGSGEQGSVGSPVEFGSLGKRRG